MPDTILDFEQFTEWSSFFADEVGSLVFDIGSHSVRIGYAGEDIPKVCRTVKTYDVVAKILFCGRIL